MIKITALLENDLGEKEELLRMLYSDDAYSCIDDVKNLLRTTLKHSALKGRELTEQEIDIIEHLSNHIFEIFVDLPGQF